MIEICMTYPLAYAKCQLQFAEMSRAKVSAHSVENIPASNSKVRRWKKRNQAITGKIGRAKHGCQRKRACERET